MNDLTVAEPDFAPGSLTYVELWRGAEVLIRSDYSAGEP